MPEDELIRGKAMNNIIDAVYENGVFKPIGEVQVKEHEKVTLKVILSDDWGKRFNQIIEKIQQKTSRFSSEEIESDITHALRETREDKYGR
jgi:predicted DNA-binding antitoxin AbrB/MazE fold protein